MASETPNYPVGTMFRYYNADKSAHHTVVMLKDGSVLETKNPNGVRYDASKFSSLSAYEETRGFSRDSCETDTKKANGIIIGSDTHRFNYPRIRQDHTQWAQWLYSILAEGTPHLLQNEELRNAYNEFVAACEEGKKDLRSNMWHSRRYYYSPKYLKDTEWNNYSGSRKWEGLCLRFWNEEYNYRSSPYTQAQYNEIRGKLLAAYKKIYAIVEKDVTAFLTKMNNKAELQAKIARNKYLEGVVKRRIQKLEAQLATWMVYTKRSQKELAEYESQLAALGY